MGDRVINVKVDFFLKISYYMVHGVKR